MEKQQLAPLPISKATNSYDFIDEVIAVIVDEPKRLFMGEWRILHNGMRTLVYVSSEKVRALRPACGTVCCVSGWMATLKRNMTRIADGEIYFPPELGFKLNEIFYTWPDADLVGTPEYVAPIVAKLRRLQQDHEEILRAFELVPPVEDDSNASAATIGLGD